MTKTSSGRILNSGVSGSSDFIRLGLMKGAQTFEVAGAMVKQWLLGVDHAENNMPGWLLVLGFVLGFESDAFIHEGMQIWVFRHIRLHSVLYMRSI